MKTTTKVAAGGLSLVALAFTPFAFRIFSVEVSTPGSVNVGNSYSTFRVEVPIASQLKDDPALIREAQESLARLKKRNEEMEPAE